MEYESLTFSFARGIRFDRADLAGGLAVVEQMYRI